MLWKLITVTITKYAFRTQCGELINFFSCHCGQIYEATNAFSIWFWHSHSPLFYFFLNFVQVWWVGTAQSVGNQWLHHWDYVLGYPTTLRSIPVLHQALVLCPSCGPEKFVWIKHDIPIINKRRGKRLACHSAASQRAFSWNWEGIH